MFGGKSIRAKFEMPKFLISDVLDYFRANVDLRTSATERSRCRSRSTKTTCGCGRDSMQDRLKSPSPPPLAEVCKQDLKSTLALYEEE